MFPLKLGNRGKYRVIIQEYRAIISEYYIKDYVIPHQISIKIIDLRKFTKFTVIIMYFGKAAAVKYVHALKLILVGGHR